METKTGYSNLILGRHYQWGVYYSSYSAFWVIHSSSGYRADFATYQEAVKAIGEKITEELENAGVRVGAHANWRIK